MFYNLQGQNSGRISYGSKHLESDSYKSHVILLIYNLIIMNNSTTPGPLYNTVRYNTVLDITCISIANTEIGWDPNNSVLKRLWCI